MGWILRLSELFKKRKSVYSISPEIKNAPIETLGKGNS
jgi:hypothetical protein